jgi:hypothetical protein
MQMDRGRLSPGPRVGQDPCRLEAELRLDYGRCLARAHARGVALEGFMH